MSLFSHDAPTVDKYALQLRNGLRDAAKASLIELEESINSMGFGWMDGYMEQILDRGNRAPIAELMKTPSRTHGTSKKTLANAAAAKDRTDKVKGLNARLALSPVGKSTSSSRMPLSPLQPRSLNAVQASPIVLPSPKSKPDKPAAATKPKRKAKATRTKQTARTNENIPSPIEANDIIPASQSSSSSSSRQEVIAISVSPPEVVQEKSKSSRNKKTKAVAEVEAVLEIEAIEVDQPVPEVPQEPELMTEVAVDDPPIMSTSALINPTKELSTVLEQEEVSTSASIALPPADTPSTVEERTEPSVPGPASSVEPEVTQPTRDTAEEENDVIDASVPIVDTSQQTASTASVVPPIAQLPSVPVRQVRSSWLSKALGTVTVPVSGVPASASIETATALRKSYAAPAQQRQSTAMDFAGLRKSLAPIGGLKRKSEEGKEDESDDEERRPEKFVKSSDPVAPTKLVENAAAQNLPARTPAPITRPALPSKTPSFAGVSADPDPQVRASNPSADNHRSNIHSVTKALDDLREKAAAKELARQRAALAASTGPPRVPQAKSTGTGFLRGLGSIGAGLLGMGGNPAEEEADRLALELEAERMAEEELEKLLRDAVKADEQVNKQDSIPAVDINRSIEAIIKPIRSTTPAASQSAVVAVKVTQSPREEEEDMVEEQSVMDELLFEEQPVHRRQQSAQQTEPESTTPVGTPVRLPAIQVEAPPLHDRPEKHLHEPALPQRKLVEREPAKAVTSQHVPSLLDEDMEMDDDDDDDADEEEELEQIEMSQRVQALRADQTARNAEANKTHRKMPSSSSSSTVLGASTSSVSAIAAGFGQAQTMAAKALGVKPSTGPVKSIALAAAAAKKEQAAVDRKAMMKEQADQRKAEIARRKAEEDRVKADLERKAKVAELEEKRKMRAEHEKRKKERDEKLAAAAKEKAAKEEREAQAAKIKAEEEAARKRKLAHSLNKSQTGAPAAKKGPQSATQNGAGKGKEPFRPSKQMQGLPASTSGQGQKMGPTSFRVAPASQSQLHVQLDSQSQLYSQSSQSSTVTLVSQSSQVQQTAERKALGPPSRPSAMAQQMRQSTATHQYQNALHHNGNPSSVLQQSRVALQTQLDEKAALVQSEDIVLPDIASEYSDSDDEDRTKDFNRPAWAESPELRAALEAQAYRDPDELFGPIKPLNMEELFKVHKGKFRARTSSANWNRGDGLTRAEEVEYARRMGFKSGLGPGREREISGSGL